VPVVIGGPHATAIPEEAARHADGVVIGEAEDTWPRVLDDALRKKLESVYRSTRQATLAGSPAPRWDLIKGRRYGKSVTIVTRGCPHRCDYCSIPLLYGPGTVRYRPVDEVVREVATSPTRAVVFWDDNIGANARYAKELFRACSLVSRTRDRRRTRQRNKVERRPGILRNGQPPPIKKTPFTKTTRVSDHNCLCLFRLTADSLHERAATMRKLGKL
jgi:radical SAM superfamily enzyme YgiQ (UPF0313 family)